MDPDQIARMHYVGFVVTRPSYECQWTSKYLDVFFENRDTVIVCFADAFTAIFGGFVVFSVLGFLSKETGTSLDKLPFAGTNIYNLQYYLSKASHTETVFISFVF
jgi:hypothetical protein